MRPQAQGCESGYEQLALVDRIDGERTPQARQMRIGRRLLKTTPVFETYWRFAARRQAVLEARLAGDPPPWTDDPIIAAHRFTNTYRVADRVSQFLISEVQYSQSWSHEDLVFRTLLFKFFNRIETWKQLVDGLGQPTWASFDFASYADVLDRMMAERQRVYSAAYIMPQPRFGERSKHQNHLRLLEFAMSDHLVERLQTATTMQAAFEILRGYPSLGPFLAYQFVIDLNYSTVIEFDEMDYVVPGPGAIDGIRKCFPSPIDVSDSYLIHYMAEHQDFWFDELGIEFRPLFGRPLQLIDCQNLFCEVDKYSRVAHPEVRGRSRRTRIKQIYRPRPEPLQCMLPPKWFHRPMLDQAFTSTKADG